LGTIHFASADFKSIQGNQSVIAESLRAISVLRTDSRGWPTAEKNVCVRGRVPLRCCFRTAIRCGDFCFWFAVSNCLSPRGPFRASNFDTFSRVFGCVFHLRRGADKRNTREERRIKHELQYDLIGCVVSNFLPASCPAQSALFARLGTQRLVPGLVHIASALLAEASRALCAARCDASQFVLYSCFMLLVLFFFFFMLRVPPDS